MAKKTTIKGKNEGELVALLSKQREDLRTLRFTAAGSRPKDASEIKKTRREIARIMTELHAQKSASHNEMLEEAPTVAATA